MFARCCDTFYGLIYDRFMKSGVQTVSFEDVSKRDLTATQCYSAYLVTMYVGYVLIGHRFLCNGHL